MDQKTLKKYLIEKFKINDQQWSQILTYKNYLQEANQKTNLTRLASEDKIYGSYFYESIVPYETIDFTNIKTILDIGSGSGIPGVVLAILFPHINVTLLDSNGKKCQFLNQLIRKVDLNNCNVINGRAEELAYTKEECYDLVTSRAVANLNAILEISCRFARQGGMVIEPKTINDRFYNKTLIEKLGLKLSNNIEFVSKEKFNHCVLVFKKVSKTKDPYPRPWNNIKDDYAS